MNNNIWTADEIISHIAQYGPARIPIRVRKSVAAELLLYGPITYQSRRLYPHVHHIGAGVHEVRWSREHWTGEPRQATMDEEADDAE